MTWWSVVSFWKRWACFQRYNKLLFEMRYWDGKDDVMRVVYDQKTDTLTIILSEAPVTESDEDKPGIILDYDASGNVVSLEILDASRRVIQPTRMEYEFAGQPAWYRRDLCCSHGGTLKWVAPTWALQQARYIYPCLIIKFPWLYILFINNNSCISGKLPLGRYKTFGPSSGRANVRLCNSLAVFTIGDQFWPAVLLPFLK